MLRGTTGESGTWETGIARPQIGSYSERMYKHTVEFLGKSGYPMNGLFVCQPLKRCGEQHETFIETVKTQSLMWMRKEQLITAKAISLTAPSGFIAHYATQPLLT